jgi:hypothetical protein
MQDSTTPDIWMTTFGKGFGGMCQGDTKTKTKTKVTDAIFIMDPHGLKGCHCLSTPKGRSV